MAKLPSNRNNANSSPRTNPAKIVLVILILTIAVADFVTIAELPYFVKKLHTEGKNSGPEKTDSGYLYGSAKNQLPTRMEIANETEYLLDLSLRPDHRLEK